jgi:hypothetical protein
MGSARSSKASRYDLHTGMWAFADAVIATVALQLGLSVVYLRAIRRSAAILRVFQYNTAALKVLVAHQANAPLTLEAVRRQSPLHPWASPNYIGLALALSPAVFYLAGRPLMGFEGSPFLLHAAFVALKIGASPLIFALTYEVQGIAVRLFEAGRMRGAWPISCALQRSVCEEPDDAQIEVSERRSGMRVIASSRRSSRTGCPSTTAPRGARASRILDGIFIDAERSTGLRARYLPQSRCECRACLFYGVQRHW